MIPPCCRCLVGHNCSSDLTPGLGTPGAAGGPNTLKKKKKKGGGDYYSTHRLTFPPVKDVFWLLHTVVRHLGSPGLSDLDSILKHLSSLDPEPASSIPTSVPLLLPLFQPGVPSPYISAPFFIHTPSLPPPFFTFHSELSHFVVFLVGYQSDLPNSENLRDPYNMQHALLCSHFTHAHRHFARGKVVERSVLKDGFAVRVELCCLYCVTWTSSFPYGRWACPVSSSGLVAQRCSLCENPWDCTLVTHALCCACIYLPRSVVLLYRRTRKSCSIANTSFRSPVGLF